MYIILNRIIDKFKGYNHVIQWNNKGYEKNIKITKGNKKMCNYTLIIPFS